MCLLPPLILTKAETMCQSVITISMGNYTVGEVMKNRARFGEI